jgi:hypothetical protein
MQKVGELPPIGAIVVIVILYKIILYSVKIKKS